MEPKELGNSSLGMQPHVEALLSYLAGFVTGIIFYVLEKENKFVRFHAMQSIITFGSLFVLSLIVSHIPFIGWVVLPVIWIAEIVLWILLMLKAYQGERFKIPFAGEIAEKNA